MSRLIVSGKDLLLPNIVIPFSGARQAFEAYCRPFFGFLKPRFSNKHNDATSTQSNLSCRVRRLCGSGFSRSHS
jgi:hypothetical protein